MALLILLLGVVSIKQTPTDIFPEIDIPVVTVVWQYPGLKLGRDLGDKVEILSGLDPAEPLVANPSGSLREGEEVKAQP